MMGRAFAVALALAAAAPAFHYERPVELAAGDAPETCVALPADLLSHASPWLQDLRVVANGRDVAYMVRISNEGAPVVARPARILNMGRRNGEVSFDVEMMAPVYQRVVLRVHRSRFSVLVRVHGMERPGDTGVALGEFAYSSNAENDAAQQRDITLPESSFRYLHFDIRTAALEPLTPRDIAGVDVMTPAAEPARYAAVADAGAPQQKPHATVYEFAVPAKVPVDRLTFASDREDAVFSRMGDLERYRPDAADKTRGKMPVQSEGISLVQLPVSASEAKPRAKPAIALALGAVRYASTVRLTIQNGDDAPLALHDVALEMRQREVCFLRHANTSYVLRYGDPKLGPAQYDMLPLTEADRNASESILGAEHALTPEEAAALLPFTERHPVLLWMALVLVVGTLGFVAFRSAQGSS